MKKLLVFALIIAVVCVLALVITDPNIDPFGIYSSEKSDQSFFSGEDGYNYEYFSDFDQDSGSAEVYIVKAWNNLEEEIDVSDFKLKDTEFENFYTSLLNSNPLCYYVDGAVEYVINGDGYIEAIRPTYTQTDKSVISKTIGDINNATSVILSTISDDMGDFEKVMAVHDYMVLNYQYDQSLSNHSITIMITKTGVCEAYSNAFMHMMNVLDIDCRIVESEEMVHSWNLVCIDGSWYHIDLTMDDPIEDKYAQASHEYALLSTDAIESASTPHYGFDIGTLSADSTKYDNASWRQSLGSIVSVQGINYWVEDNDIVSSNGSTIYSDLDGGDDMWNITERKGYRNVCLSGLGVHNNVLYFNTDEAIMSYDPSSGNTNILKTKSGICSIFVVNGTLYYGESSGNGSFVYGGEFAL